MANNTLGINIQLNGAAAAAAGLNGVGDAARNAGSGATSGFSEASSAAGGLTTAVKAIGGAFAGLALVDFAKQAAHALSEAQQAADKLRNSLTYSSGSAAGAAREMQYLREVSASLGLDFNSAGAAYAKFAASTKGSGITIAETKTVFEGISQAAAKLGLSASEVEGALLAVSQMASKGTVASEELRGQLAERLPGAFGTAAKAMGVTTAELGKLLESGKVLSADFLPKFGRALKDEFGGAVNSLTQEINRLNSSWDIWKQTFANSDGGGMRYLANGINESSAAMRNLGKEAGVTHKILIAIGGVLAGLAGVGKFDTQGMQKAAMEKLADVRNQREALQANGMNYLDLGKLDILKQQEAELRSKIEELAVRRGKEANLAPGALKQQLDEEKAAPAERRARALKSYLDDLSNAPKAAKVAAAVEVENKAFEKAVSGFAETDKGYLSALKAHHERLAEIQKGPKGGAGGTKNDFAQMAADQLAAERDFTKTQLELVKERVAQRAMTEEAGIEETWQIQAKGLSKQTELLSAQFAGTKDKGDRARIEQQLQAIGNDALVAAEKYTTAMARIDAAQRKEMASILGAEGQRVAGIDEQNKALQEQLNTIGLSGEALAAYTRAKFETAAAADLLTAANLEEAASTLEGSAAAETARQYYLELASAKRASAEALQEQGRLTAAVDSAKAADDAWKKTASSIEQSLTDALMRGFESGKDFASNFKTTLVNLFKTMILRPVIQATVTGSLAGFSGAGNAATGGTGVETVGSVSSGGIGSITSALSTAKSAYDLITGGASNTYASLAKSAIGQQLGLSSVNSGGLGVPSVAGGVLDSSSFSTTQLTTLGESVGSGLATVGGGLIGSAIGNAIAGDKRIISGISGSNVGAVAGAAIGSIVPGLGTAIGGALGGVLGGVLDAAFGSGKKEIKASGISGTFSGSGFEGQSWDFWKKSGGWFGGGKKGTDYSPLDASTSNALSASFALLKLQTGKAAESLGVDTAAIAGYAKDIQIQLTEDATANSKAIADMLGGISDDLAQLALSGTNFGQASETAAQTLTRLSTSLGAVNEGLALTHLKSLGVSLAAGALASSLASAMGGIDAFKTSVSAYYESYFSDAEKQQDLVASLTKSFAAMNMALPPSKEVFRSLVEGLDLTTAAGEQAFSGMMALSGAFAKMTDAADAAASAAAASAAEADKVAKENHDAEVKRIGDARAALLADRRASEQAATDLVNSLSASFADIQKSAAVKPSSGGDLNGLSFSAAERYTVSAFVDFLGQANAKLKEIAASPITDAMTSAAAAINAMAKQITGVAAEKLFEARMFAADFAGALAAKLSQIEIPFNSYVKNGAFNAAEFNDAQELAVATALQSRSNFASANALQLQHVMQVVSGSSGGSISREFIGRQAAREMESAGITGEAVNIVSEYVQKSISDGLRDRFASSGPGIASVLSARDHLNEMINLPSAVSRAEEALTSLSAAFDTGKIDAKSYAASVDAVNSAFGGGIPTEQEIKAKQQFASVMLVAAGIQSLNFYFGKLGDTVSALAEEAAKSNAPIAASTGAIGRMVSAYSVFGQSAQAAATLGVGGLDRSGFTTTINGALVASAAKMASSVISTQSAADVQKQLSGNFSGASRRNASLLLDGIGTYDTASFEQGFQRISDALAKGVIGEEQFKELFDIAITTYTGQSAKNVTDAFTELSKAALSLADDLTLAAQATPQDTLAEATRQYLATVAAAKTGDSTAISGLSAAAKAMLEAQKGQSGTELAYRLSVAQTAADMRALGEANAPAKPTNVSPDLSRIFTPTFANGGQTQDASQSVVDELKALREDLKSANAALAINTNNTAKILQRWTVDGMPAVAV